MFLLLFIVAGSPQVQAQTVNRIEPEAGQLRLAAEQGDAEAQFNLSLAYYRGDAVPQDRTEAVRWYRLAAEQGHAGAQSLLGDAYNRGKGMPQDNMIAYAWLNIAAAQLSDDNVKRLRDHCAEAMTAKQLAAAQALSREYWQRYVIPFR